MREINRVIPLVSILIPVYNNEKYIGQAIESALNQTWPSKEIIVVNDGSTDQSLLRARKYEDFGVQVINQPNKGASSARNLGIQASKGDYIQFLDADDQLSHDKIECQVLALNNSKDKIAVCSTIYFFDHVPVTDPRPPVYEESFLYTTDNTIDFLIHLWGGRDFKASMIQPNAWLTPKTLITKVGGWNESITVDDDGEFFTRIILGSKGIVKSNGFNYYRKYRGLTANLSSKKTRKALESSVISAFLKKKYLFALTNDNQAKKAIFTQLTELAIHLYINHASLYKLVDQELDKLPSFKYNPVVGGHVLNFISNQFGWKSAKRIQHIYATFRQNTFKRLKFQSE